MNETDIAIIPALYKDFKTSAYTIYYNSVMIYVIILKLIRVK